MNFQAVMQLMQAGRFADAAAQCQAFLRQHPQHPGALCMAGICLAELGQPDKAIMALELATMLAPDFADAHKNLGLLYMKAGRLEEAEQRFRQVIASTPPAAGSYAQLGMVLAQAGRNDEAIEAFQVAIRFDQTEPAFHKMLGDTLHSAGRLEDAYVHHDHAIKLWRAPPDATFFEHMWRSYTARGLGSSALDLLTKWLQHDPANPVALHCLAASGGASAPTRASDGYVQGTFDAFAASYDEQLAALENRGPELIAQAVKELGSPVASVLDAGCGTGLCGHALRPLATRLVGIDLSGKMLEKARARGIYDTLSEAELCSYLENQTAAFDWIVSGDTFCYFGDLRALTNAARKALRAKGYLIFTAEDASNRGSVDSFELLPQGRYCHGEAYIDRTLREAGFTQITIKHDSLRKEGKDWVPCMVVRCQAP
jgi:predicted TPR repeat methyltransferase